MGMVLDGQGRYDEAMSAFLEAKKLILPNATQFIANQKMVHARLKLTEGKLTAEAMGRWKAALRRAGYLFLLAFLFRLQLYVVALPQT